MFPLRGTPLGFQSITTLTSAVGLTLPHGAQVATASSALFYGNLLVVGGTLTGTFGTGQLVVGSGVPINTYITGPGPAPGSWYMNNAYTGSALTLGGASFGGAGVLVPYIINPSLGPTNVEPMNGIGVFSAILTDLPTSSLASFAGAGSFSGNAVDPSAAVLTPLLARFAGSGSFSGAPTAAVDLLGGASFGGVGSLSSNIWYLPASVQVPAAGVAPAGISVTTYAFVWPDYALITPTGQNVVWRDDGTPPTASTGNVLATTIPEPWPYFGDLTTIQFIQSTATAALDVSYYKIAG